MYKWLLFCLLCLSLRTAQGSVLQCCEDGAKWNGTSSNCTDGTSVNLECGEIGMFKVDPHDKEENYKIRTEDGRSWLVVWVESGLYSYDVSEDSYCLTTQAEDPSETLYALVCFGDDGEEHFKQERKIDIFFGFCSIISSFFLAITLVVYLILPGMRDLQDKAIMCLCASFMVAFFIIGIMKLSPYTRTDGSLDTADSLATADPSVIDDESCLFLAFLMYYSFLSAFFWLNALSLNIWKSVWFPWLKVRDNHLFIFYCGMGYFLPFLFLVVSVISHHQQWYFRPGFGEGNTCWFRGAVRTWLYFYGPILALVLMNLFYLGMTSWKLWLNYRDINSCRVKVFRFKCWMYVKLALMMGFTWIFEILSYAFAGEGHAIYWDLPDILNVLQGFFIFILFVVSRKKVRRQLAERRPCNIPFPKSWAAYQDEENCVKEELGPDEVELSQTYDDQRFYQKEMEANNVYKDKC